MDIFQLGTVLLLLCFDKDQREKLKRDYLEAQERRKISEMKDIFKILQ
jgi:hypothetical protein